MSRVGTLTGLGPLDEPFSQPSLCLELYRFFACWATSFFVYVDRLVAHQDDIIYRGLE